jgi:hypothetical protein
MMLGEAVAGLRIGDIDGYEDTARRKALDAMGFVWGKHCYICIHVHRCVYICFHIQICLCVDAMGFVWGKNCYLYITLIDYK